LFGAPAATAPASHQSSTGAAGAASAGSCGQALTLPGSSNAWRSALSSAASAGGSCAGARRSGR
jgi:hypothetical protein